DQTEQGLILCDRQLLAVAQGPTHRGEAEPAHAYLSDEWFAQGRLLLDSRRRGRQLAPPFDRSLGTIRLNTASYRYPSSSLPTGTRKRSNAPKDACATRRVPWGRKASSGPRKRSEKHSRPASDPQSTASTNSSASDRPPSCKTSKTVFN